MVGMGDGRHYTEWTDTVKQFKREGRLAEAEALLLKSVDAVEEEQAAKGWAAPAPWSYGELAIIYRKQKEPAKEVAILERYLRAAGIDETQSIARGYRLYPRLEKARELLGASNAEPSKAFCPYCGVEIVPPPAKSRKCPACAEQVIVAKRVGEYVPSLMTAKQAEENVQAGEDDRTRKKALEDAYGHGFSMDAVDATVAKLTAVGGRSPSPNDLLWHLTIDALVVGIQKGDWAAVHKMYCLQGHVLEAEGRSTVEADQHANDAQLRNCDRICVEQGRPREVVVFTHDTCCPDCARRSGQTVQIAAAMAGNLLPNLACTNARCRCSWRIDYDAPQRATRAGHQPASQSAKTSGLWARLFGGNG